jgi:hypothetical protein
MDRASSDHQIRAAAFDFLDLLALRHGEALPSIELRAGFTFEGQRVPLMGPQGSSSRPCSSGR